jgi:hypothetical protein
LWLASRQNRAWLREIPPLRSGGQSAGKQRQAGIDIKKCGPLLIAISGSVDDARLSQPFHFEA